MKTGRRLGATETQMALFQDLLAGTTQVTTAVVLAGHLPPARLELAVARLAARHPLLRCRLVHAGGALGFAPVEADMPLPVVMRPWDSAETLAGLMEREMSETLPAGGRLWRLMLRSAPSGQRHELFFTRHHAMTDGISSTRLLRELFDGAVATGSEPLVAPLEAFLAEAPLTRATAVVPPVTHLIPHAETAPLAARRTRVLFQELTRAETATLRQAARNHGVSLHAHLVASLAQAASASGLGRALTVQTAVSLRRRGAHPVPEGAIGCYIGVARVNLEVAARDPWDLAAEYRRSLEAATTALVKVRPSTVVDLQERARMVGEMRAFAGIGITNLGRIDLDVPGHVPGNALTVTDYRTSACRSASPTAFVLHVAELRNALSFTWTWAEPLMPGNTVAAIATHFIKGLTP